MKYTAKEVVIRVSEFSDMNLAQKVAAIRKMVPVVQKSKKGFGYTYVPLEEIQAKVTAAMDKMGVNIYPSVVPGTASITPYSYTKQKVIKDGNGNPKIIDETVNEFLYTADTIWHIVNVDNPDDSQEIPWFASANMGDASQTVNSANTYQARGFLSCYLQMAMTETDPEVYRSKKLEVEDAENRLASKTIVDDLHKYVLAYLSNHEDKRKEVTKLITKHNIVNGKGNPDYFKITDPKTAMTLYEEIRKQFPLTQEVEVAKN